MRTSSARSSSSSLRICPRCPLLQGKQVAIVGADVEGATLDGSFKFRYAPLNK